MDGGTLHPEFNLKAASQRLRRLCLQLLALQTLALLAVAAVLSCFAIAFDLLPGIRDLLLR